MPFDRLPPVSGCCYCITDLKTAAAIIAVLAIVTNPALSWAAVRHSYVIRVSCIYKTNQTRPDVVDISFNNVISFGFGANAGQETSCLKETKSSNPNPPTRRFALLTSNEAGENSGEKMQLLLKFVRGSGWILMFADTLFLISACTVLVRIYRVQDIRIIKIFIITAMISTFLAFVYGIFFIIICIVVGSSFPVFELIFVIVDFGLWAYFILVLNAYRKSCG